MSRAVRLRLPVPVAVVGLLGAALLGAPAAAEERATLVTETTLERWSLELTPRIEAAAGRKFVERPKLALATRATVVEREARLHRTATTLGADPPTSLVDPSLVNVLGLYLHGTQEVFFLTDNVESTFVDHRFAPKLLHPVMRCIVAHELVHALQHQHAPVYESDDAEVTRVALSLREGHADFIAATVCGDGNRYLDMAQGLDVPASRAATDPGAFAYGYAETFIGALDAAAGPEAVWNVLTTAPPPRALVARVGSAGLPGGWTDAAPLTAVARTLAPRTRGVAGPLSPASVLVGMAGDEDIDIDAVAGLGHVDTERAFLATVAFLLRDEAVPAAWVEARRAALKAGKVRVLGGVGMLARPAKVGDVRAVAKDPGVGATLSLRIELSSGEQYVEAWAARGRYLFGVVHRDDAADAKAAAAALGALLDLDLPDLPDASARSEADRAEADRAELLALAPSAPLSPGVSWQYRRDELYPAVLREDWAACLAQVDTGMTGLDRAGQGALAEHGLRCALHVEDLAAADRYHARLAAPAPVDLALVYAQLLAGARRWNDALVALPAGVSAEDVRFAAALRLQANVYLRRWPEVERLVLEQLAPAAGRAWAASELARVGRTATARTALRTACPALESAGERAQCGRLLGELGG